MADLPEGFTIDQPAHGGQLPAGFTLDEAKPARPTGGFDLSTAGDVGHSLATGAAKGVIGLAGLPGDLSNLVGSGADWVAEKVTGERPKSTGPILPTSHEIQGDVEDFTGKFYQPQTTAGKYAQTAGEFAGNPLTYTGVGSIPAKAMTGVAAGLGSEAAGQLTEGHAAEPYARVAGAILGGAGPRVAARAVTPLPISAERQAAVTALRNEGIEPTAGQASGSRAVRYAESHLGELPGAGGAAAREDERVGAQLTRAALARVGETADRATPQVVDRAFRRIGGQFDALAGRNSAAVDTQYMNDVFNAQNQYDHLFVDPLRRPQVQSVVDHAVNQVARSRVMDGDVYKAVRSRIERMRRGQRNDPEMGGFLAEMRDAMDNLMERSIQANNPADLGAWREVRNQYRNMLVVERLNTGGGMAAAEGTVTPGHLRQATSGAQGRRNYARGQGDFADLTRNANEILHTPPQSGTAPRMWTTAVPAAASAAGAALYAGQPLAAAGIAAAPFVPGLTGRALLSRPTQAYLKNQAMTDVIRRLPPSTLRSLMAAGTSPDRGFARGGSVRDRVRHTRKRAEGGAADDDELGDPRSLRPSGYQAPGAAASGMVGKAAASGLYDTLVQPFVSLGRLATGQSQAPGSDLADASGAIGLPGKAMLAKGLAAVAGAAAPKVLGEVAAKPATEAATQAIKAYHASPHNFDKFDIGKIGTGEGNQSYGHGIYAAENPAVSGRGGEYDKSFTAKTGKPAHIYEVGINASPEHFLDWDRPLSEQSANVRKVVNDLGLNGEIEKLKPHLGDSGEAIHKALESHFFNKELAARGALPHPSEVSGIQSTVAKKLGEAGIPGIKYADQGSRNLGLRYEVSQKHDGTFDLINHRGGTESIVGNFKSRDAADAAREKAMPKETRNYVVFDDKLIDIMKKYGIAGIGALPAMGAYHYREPASGG